MRLRKSILFLLFLTVFPILAWSSDIIVSAPQGLTACTPENPLLSGMQRIAAQFGTLSGCFVSNEQAPVHGANKPLEFAFAITFSQGTSVSFTTADVDKFYLATEKQWENVQPLWSRDKSAYERYVQELVKKASPDSSSGSMSIEQPVLVSMQRIDPNAYTVVSIRRRKMSDGGDTFSLDDAQGFALILSKGTLVRLTIERQLRGQEDVDAVKSQIVAWVQSFTKE